MEKPRRGRPTGFSVSLLPRLGPSGAHEDLLHRVGLMGLTGPARWEDPHWPGSYA